MRIKICGITTPEDASAALGSGADAIGLVFYPKSPRAVTVEQAARISACVPPLASVVALFVNETAERIGAILSRVPVDIIQFHGEESAEFCQQFGRPYIKAVRVTPELDLNSVCHTYSSARGLLLDAFVEGKPGGTGQAFDWQLARQELSLPLVLAGGLNARNVAAGIGLLHPAAVDVSGGVESSPGVKDIRKIREFVAAVKAAEF